MSLIQDPDVRVITTFDPQVQPVVAAAPSPGLPVGVLTLDHIREAFANPVHWQVEPHFSRAFAPDPAACSGARRAAVLVPLVSRPAGLQVLLTRRSEHLHNHAGQVSFPGGVAEETDADAVATALRETREEIGVPAQFIQVIGVQPALLTSTRFLMTPVVAALTDGFSLRAQDAEVAEIFEVPLDVLMDPGRYELRCYQAPGREGRYFYSIAWQSHFIWGATAVLLRNFYHFLAASFSSRMR